MKITILTYILSIFLVIASCDTKNAETQTDTLTDKDSLELKDTVDSQESNEIIYNDLVSNFGKDSIDNWGQGIISDMDYNSGEMLNFIDTAIEVYDKPEGNIIGKIYRVPNWRYGLLFEDYNNSTVKKINRKDYKEVTYEGNNLKYFQEDKEFINCFIHSTNNGVWIKKEELEKHNFTSMNWKDFLIESQRMMHPPYKTAIPLFDSTGQFKDSLNYGEFELLLIDKEINDLIKVEIYNPDDCAGGDGKKVGNAWIELIDKNGHPTVFYYSRGC